MKKLKLFIRKTQLDISDFFAFTGVGLIAVGAWLIYVPASYIFVGAFFFWVGIGRSGGD